jgi:hypothetical protein
MDSLHDQEPLNQVGDLDSDDNRCERKQPSSPILRFCLVSASDLSRILRPGQGTSAPVAERPARKDREARRIVPPQNGSTGERHRGDGMPEVPKLPDAEVLGAPIQIGDIQKLERISGRLWCLY